MKYSPDNALDNAMTNINTIYWQNYFITTTFYKPIFSIGDFL